MITQNSFRTALVAGALLATAAVQAQESGALIDALIRKGILTHQEAEDIRADLVRENNTVPSRAMAGGKSTDRLSVGMRMQIQYAHLDTDVRGPVAQPAATDHFLLRRMYLTLKAGVGGDWGATMTYDFAANGYDDAYVDWRPNNELTFNFGLRKVNVAYEERASSGDIRGLERSSVTRYFVESNNGRRLGAASYRVGVFLDGRRPLSNTTNFTYSAAVTTPERNETFSLASSPGDGSTNQPALWANAALNGKLAENAGAWLGGVGVGFLPDQGGFGVANLGRGNDLTVYSVYTDFNYGRFNFMAEYLAADVERGAASGADATPMGFFVQPAFMVTATIEAVVRYAWLDTDRRGLTLGDVIRSAPSGGTMNKSAEWYVGANLYLRGNDLKYQLGLVHAKSTETVTGAPAEAKAVGVRSQLQLQF